MYDTAVEQGGTFNLRRRLVDTEVGYVVTVPGNTFEGVFQSISHFQNNYQDVPRSLGVSDDEVGHFFHICATFGSSVIPSCFFIRTYLDQEPCGVNDGRSGHCIERRQREVNTLSPTSIF